MHICFKNDTASDVTSHQCFLKNQALLGDSVYISQFLRDTYCFFSQTTFLELTVVEGRICRCEMAALYYHIVGASKNHIIFSSNVSFELLLEFAPRKAGFPTENSSYFQRFTICQLY